MIRRVAQVSIQDVVVDAEHYKNVVARFGPEHGRLLGLAHLLGQSAPSRPVELVAYTLEEPPHFRSPHMGSGACPRVEGRRT